jgi:Na+-transporting methylmalonyl-CoA/oxaloacetate decarboxylase beta subunit
MKSPKILKSVAVITGILTGLEILYYIFYPLVLRLYLNRKFDIDIENNTSAGSIGIIGGADGPTAIFVKNNNIRIIDILGYGFGVVCAAVFVVSVVLMIKAKKSKLR